MAEDDDKEIELKPGQSPTAAVENSIFKEQRKKKDAELKIAMADMNKAAEVFFAAVDKVESIYEELGEIEKPDLAAIRKAFNK